MKVAVAAIARPTFDVDFAREVSNEAFAALRAAGADPVGTSELLMETDAVDAAAATWGDVDALVVLQATFADSTLVAAAARASDARLKLWGFPEERSGARLRLNSLCGINLAAYALTDRGRKFDYAYGPPTEATATDLLAGRSPTRSPRARPPDITPEHRDRAAYVAQQLQTARLGVIGDHPAGFEPCAYSPGRLKLLGPTVDRIELADLFAAADAASSAEVGALRWRAEGSLGMLNQLAQDSLDQSLRIGCGLQALIKERKWSAVATRCWPECFTEYGGAVCSPHAMLSEDGIPGMCEADVYGGVTALILHWFTGGPAFVADLVEVSGDTGVFWHCGNAPVTMAGADPRPTVHSNRGKPLLGEFVLRPGVMTVLRVSQSSKRQRLVIGKVRAIDAPLPFGGTSAVVRFDRPMLPTIMGEGLEHHYGLAYGDVTAELWALADELGVDVVAL